MKRTLVLSAKSAGADGITNVRFYSKLSPLSYLSVFIVPVFDFYAEGIAIKKQ